MTYTESQRNKKKILLGKIGLDGHDRGIKIVINILKISGYQVIYSGLHNLPSQIIDLAIQEDVDAIGISILSGSHIEQIRALKEQIRQNKLEKIPLFAGGVIKTNEIPLLKSIGVLEVFSYGIPSSEIISWIDSVLLD